ncbi:serine/threonine-protein kinase [Archangium gephyra]|uniref:non-specific serine/threonine protein kinase n=1 Tax=Archangium gephyra TaxID=48 RepID=A0AAC8Q601_9BACT|nr:serine/threonine-protein kinase [Archangium gephyra]AKJ01675.1 Serine/threonine protein kinase [Archangium gephyra]REG34488.1 serine/threonine-protein kinase [Archangium gephyra]
MSPPLHPHQLRPGHHLRDFLIVRRLGVGGFSFVFLVERAGRRYSLKMAARPASKEDEDRVDDWMRREVTSLEHLEHPHLLPVLERGRWPDPEKGYAYFVTPHVSGITFHDWRWRKRVPLQRAMGALCELLKTLEVLHERGICHRDVKAENLLVREGDDALFLIDFGAVHLPCASALTDGLAPGTLHCQPPEAVLFLAALLSADPPRDARLEARPAADLYAVGVLLYETLTNCRPFSTRVPLEQLLATIASTPPLEPGRLAPGAPESLCGLTLRLLAKEPAQRPPSAGAVREELNRLLGEEGQTAAWQAPAQLPSECTRVRELFPDVDLLEEPREELAEPELSDPPRENAPPAREERTSKRLWRLTALALGLGVLGLGWMLLRAEPTAPVTPAHSEKGTPPMPPLATEAPDTSSTPPQTGSRRCALLSSLLGVATAQLLGCATAPVRPDPISYLASCSPEARATPVKLGIKPDEQGSFIEPESGTPVSDESIEDGGALNIKPGPITASIFVEMNGQELYLKITGEAVTTPNRVYIQFDRLYLSDGTMYPICGVAVDGKHQYGIPTYAKLPMHGAKVDPARVDKSPGSAVLNDPRFETVLQGPEGYYVPRVDLAPPDWR